MKLNGKEYPVPEINGYKDLVRLEAQGIKIMALSNGEFYNPDNLATSVVKGVSYFTGLSFEEALDEVSEHIDNGSGIDSLLEDLTRDIETMKEYGAKEGFSKGVKTPQDHKKSQAKK